MIAHAGALSVGVAYTLQVVGQRRVDPARAGIILSLKDAIAVIAEMDFAGRDSSGYGRMHPHAGGTTWAQVRVQTRSGASALDSSS